MKCKFLGRVGTCYTEKSSSTSKIMQMYIALYALVTWQLKLKTLSVKNLFSNCLWFSYPSTFHMFSIYKTMVHNKSDLAQSIILWSSPGQIFIQGIWLRIDENRVNFFIFILRSKWPSWTMVQLEFMTDSSVQVPQWRFKVKLEKNECTKSMKKFQVYSDHAMRCNHTLLQWEWKDS